MDYRSDITQLELAMKLLIEKEYAVDGELWIIKHSTTVVFSVSKKS